MHFLQLARAAVPRIDSCRKSRQQVVGMVSVATGVVGQKAEAAVAGSLAAAVGRKDDCTALAVRLAEADAVEAALAAVTAVAAAAEA